MTDPGMAETPGAGGHGINGEIRRLAGAVWASRRSESTIRNVAIVGVFVALFITLSVSSSAFLTERNLMNIVDQNAAVCLVAVGATVVVIAGGLDISIGATYGLAAVVAALVANALGGPAGWCAGVLAGGVAGAASGALIIKLKVNSLLITLATSLVIGSLATVLTNSIPVTVSGGSFTDLGRGEFLGVTYAIWLLIVTVVLLSTILNKTTLGRHIFAMGGNAEAARMAGVPIALVAVAVFVIGGLATGLAGTLDASRISQGAANSGSSILLLALGAVFLGGTSVYGGEGSIWRTLVGMGILALMNNGFTLLGLPSLYQPMIQGVVIIVAVALDAWSARRSTGVVPPLRL